MGVNKTSDICSVEPHWEAARLSSRASTDAIYVAIYAIGLVIIGQSMTGNS